MLPSHCASRCKSKAHTLPFATRRRSAAVASLSPRLAMTDSRNSWFPTCGLRDGYIWKGSPNDTVLAESSNQGSVAIRAIEALHIERSLALSGKNRLTDAEYRRAARDAQIACRMRVGGSGIHLFVGGRYFKTIVVFQDRKQRDPGQFGLSQAGAVLG